MADAATIAVVVVTYNSGTDVAEGLARLSDQLGAGDELIVVDNASSDDSVEVVQQAAPRARVLALDENLGFAGGVNRGASEARGDLLLLLNPDAIPGADCLDELRRAAAEHPTWGCWQAMVTLADGAHVNTAGGRLHLLGFGWSGDWGAPVDATLRPHEVGFASGAALCIRAELWRSLGGFDPRFFMYFEDYDLSMRVGREAAIAYVPEARIVHHGGEAARKGWRHVAWFVTSAWRFFRRHGWKLA